MTIKLILATGVNGELGHSDGRLPFVCPEDMAYFRRKTRHHNVVMGRKTFDTLGLEYGLPSRVNHVISRTPNSTRKNKVGEYTVEGMKDLIKIYESMGYKDTWIMGGKEIYLEMLDVVDEIHHTIIRDTDADADVIMKMTFLLEGDWLQVSAMELSKNATVFVWKRRSRLFEDLETSLKQAVEISKESNNMYLIRCVITGKFAVYLELDGDWSFNVREEATEFDTYTNAEHFIEKHKLLNVEIIQNLIEER